MSPLSRAVGFGATTGTDVVGWELPGARPPSGSGAAAFACEPPGSAKTAAAAAHAATPAATHAATGARNREVLKEKRGSRMGFKCCAGRAGIAFFAVVVAAAVRLACTLSR